MRAGDGDPLWELLAEWEALLEAGYAADRLRTAAADQRRRLEGDTEATLAGGPVPSLLTPESGLGGLAPAYAFALRPSCPVFEVPVSDDVLTLD